MKISFCAYISSRGGLSILKLCMRKKMMKLEFFSDFYISQIYVVKGLLLLTMGGL